MSKQSNPVRAAFFPIDFPVGVEGMFSVADATSSVQRLRIASCILDTINQLAQVFGEGDRGEPATILGWNFAYLISMAKGLVDSIDLPEEGA